MLLTGSMAPELYFKNTGYSSAVDLWSLGCAVVDAFNGSVPYDMELRRHVESSAPLPHHQSINFSPQVLSKMCQCCTLLFMELLKQF